MNVALNASNDLHVDGLPKNADILEPWRSMKSRSLGDASKRKNGHVEFQGLGLAGIGCFIHLLLIV